jgi:di/tripeptidase
MNKEKLKEVLSLPSISGNESIVRNYIADYAIKNDIKAMVDDKGNIYLTKGSDKMTEGEFYPCVVSHMDTVHRSHSDLIEKDLRLDIEEYDHKVDTKDGIVNQTGLIAKLPGTDTQTGIGGDDKCGVFVCLEMFKEFDILKGAFFVEEEIGMKGSKEADIDFFKNVGYAIQFDAPSANWITETCSGVKLFDDEFKELIKETLSACGYTNFSYDPFTDVNQLAQKFDFCCLNLGCGYYRQHTNGEYVIVEEVEKSVIVGINLIYHLGIKDYIHKKESKILKEGRSETINLNAWGNVGDYEFDEYDELLDMSENIAESVTEMVYDGADISQIKEFIYNYLDDNIYN